MIVSSVSSSFSDVCDALMWKEGYEGVDRTFFITWVVVREGTGTSASNVQNCCDPSVSPEEFSICTDRLCCPDGPPRLGIYKPQTPREPIQNARGLLFCLDLDFPTSFQEESERQ